MCGVYGIIGAENDSWSGEQILAHRGPDAHGAWKSVVGEMPVRIGHTRLSIIGVGEIGNQPMISADERFIFVFNGEIYNFIELRVELEKKRQLFVTNTDTEVFFRGLVLEGPEFMLKCNGMWAFCLWDRKEKSALFGRDRFGKKPLFYTLLPAGGIAFASEMKALYPLLATLRPSKKINEHLSFLFDYEHTEDCVVDGVKRIPPGYLLKYKDGKVKCERWWCTLDYLEEPPSRYEDQVERWRELFLDAVRIRMRSDVSIGTALSGGLDSSAIFCSMAHLSSNLGIEGRQAKDWRHGFCSHFPGSSLDELKWAKIVTDSLNMQLGVVEINPLNSGWQINQAMYQVEDPYITLPFPMLATYGAISKAGIKVTLDGHGADELFSGYGHLNSAFTSANPKQLAELIAIQESTSSGVFNPDYEYLRLKWIKTILLQYAKYSTQFPRKISSALLGNTNWESLGHQLKFDDQSHPAFRMMDPLSQKLYELFHITTLPTLLRNYDRYSMASGVEIRMPFLDWRLVAFTFSLPWTSKVGGGFTKRIMRDALKGIIPEDIRVRRDKIGWNAPMHEWLKGALRGEIEAFIQSGLCPPRLEKQWETFLIKPNADFSSGQLMWERLLPYIWKKSLNSFGGT
jgi:asparagine synthase (glutamine-hydrolysing)